MITVRYAIRDGYGEWQEAVGKGTTVEFRLTDVVAGSLSLGGRTAEIKDGACKINTKGLAYGQYTPLLITDTGIKELEPLILSREEVTPAKTEDKIHRLALLRIAELEAKEKENKERIDELFTLIKGRAIFG